MSTNPITRHLLALALLLGGLLPLAGCATVQRPASTPSLAITHVTVVDVEAGERLADHTVVVEGDRITAVGPSAEVAVPTDATVVDGTGRYVIPGLWDMHAHLNGEAVDSTAILPLYVVNGVTGVRDMWSDPPGVVVDSARGTTMLQAMQRLRDHAEARRMVGPRLVLTTAPLDGPFGPDSYVHVVRTAMEAEAVVAEAAQRGVDAVGLYRWLAPGPYIAAGEAARQHGLPLAGLAPIAATFEEMAAAGHRVRDGLLEWELACSSVGDSLRAELRDAAARDAATSDAPERSQSAQHLAARPRLRATFDAERCARAAREVAADGVWQNPRLVYGLAETSGRANAARALAYLPAGIREAWMQRTAQIARDSAGVASAQARLDRALVRTLHQAGVPLLVGTEAYWGSPATWGFSVHDELVELVGAGLSPLDALRAATLNPARALGREADLGTVAVGKLADLVLLDADPLADITNTTQIRAVVLDGRLLTRADLDRLLADAETAAVSD